MPARARLTSAREREAFRSAKRACYAGLDSVTLRTELARRVAAAVPWEAYSFSTTDPDTGLLTHGVGENLPESLVESYITQLYPYEDVLLTIDSARAGETVVSMAAHSALFLEVLRSAGLEHEINTLACTGEALWGSFCMLRENGARAFSDRERVFMRLLAPHVARALRTAAVLDLPRREAVDEELPGAGVLVLDGRGRVVVRNAAASAHLRDLADVGIGTEEMPYAVASVLVRLHFQRGRQPTGAPEAAEDAELRVRGRSGRWYTLRASVAEPDASGDSSAIVVIESVRPRELAPTLARLYGLTPREREVLVLAARGETTKRIAARLGLSAHTVQDHLDNACAKVGVRGRKALLARLYFDTQAAGAE